MERTVGGSAAASALAREGPVEPDLQHAGLFAVGVEPGGGLGGGLGPRAHDDDHAVGLGMAFVVEQVVVAAGELGKQVHRLLRDGGGGLVEAVDGFAGLEEHIGVLGRAAQHGMVRGEAAAAEGGEGVGVDERAQGVVARGG